MTNKILLSKYHEKKPLLKSKEAIEIANLIVKIFPEYYDCFGASLLQKRNVVKKLFFKKNFEFEKIYTIKLGKKLVGVATVINSKRLKIAKTLGFLKIINYLGLEKVNKRKISILKKSFCKINSSKPYLTRFGVNSKFRGIKNLSSRLVRYVIKNEKFKLIAHVNKNNKRAIKFYLKNKFKIIDKRKKFYLIEFKGIKKVYEN